MTPPLPKRYGKSLPLIINPDERICFTIQVPDILEYKAAIYGVVGELGEWFTWEHYQSDYINPPTRNKEAAELWVQLLADAVWSECMSFCEQLIACLTTDTDTQEALAELIRTNPAIGEALSQYMKEHPTGTVYPKLQPLPPAVTAGNILPPNPGCDPDILYAQCIGIVQTANRMTEDFLQTWEVYNNSGEVLSDIVQAIPLVGEIADIIGIPGMIEYANDLVDSIAENYLADYSLEYEQQLACEIFCAAKDTCVVSIDMLTNIMNARIGSALNLDNGIDLMLSLIDMDVSGFNVADLYLAAFFNMLKVANLILPITWGIEGYLSTIKTFNTPDDDWQELCEDCPSPANEWRISGRYPQYALGVILEQTTSKVRFGASENTDGIWRLDFIRDLGCVEITALEYPPASDYRSAGCGVSNEGEYINVGDVIDRGGVAKFVYFELELEW